MSDSPEPLPDENTCVKCGQVVVVDIQAPSKTDDRPTGEWSTRYPDAATRQIRHEALYVAGSFVVYLLLIAIVSIGAEKDFLDLGEQASSEFTPYALSLIGGCLGGTMFSMKWLYHTVAKNIWNIDRRWWRYFTPALSGGAALGVVLLTSAGAFPLFDRDIAQTPQGALGIGLVLGYFSDRVFSILEGFAKKNLGSATHEVAADRTRGAH